jgi:hypothetical protein
LPGILHCSIFNGQGIHSGHHPNFIENISGILNPLSNFFTQEIFNGDEDIVKNQFTSNGAARA